MKDASAHSRHYASNVVLDASAPAAVKLEMQEAERSGKLVAKCETRASR
jgi:hypothetical protein